MDLILTTLNIVEIICLIVFIIFIFFKSDTYVAIISQFITTSLLALINAIYVAFFDGNVINFILVFIWIFNGMFEIYEINIKRILSLDFEEMEEMEEEKKE